MKAFSLPIVRSAFALALIGVSAGFCLSGNRREARTDSTDAANAAGAQTATAKIVRAANAFLATLNEKQKKSVLFAFDDEQQRARWSNFPTGFVPRAGVKLGDLAPAQRSAALALLASALSRRGYEKVQQIMEADEILKKDDRSGPPPGGGGGRPGGPPDGSGPPLSGGPRRPVQGRGPRGGGGAMFGKDLYYFSFLGKPSETAPWTLQFGGHHLALNITIIGAKGILTPSLTGAQPAMYTLNNKTVRPLGQESDKALALLDALDAAQRKKAILNYRVGDLVLGPGQDGKTILPEGLKASEMTARQRTMLLDVIAEWADIVHDSAAADRRAEIKADLSSTYFAWSGATTVQPGHNITAYYRIQGPKLVIEYSPQRLGGDLALHVHTIYRDPTNDYGRKPAAQ